MINKRQMLSTSAIQSVLFIAVLSSCSNQSPSNNNPEGAPTTNGHQQIDHDIDKENLARSKPTLLRFRYCYIPNGMLNAIYKDKLGDLCLGGDGVYKFNGESFDRMYCHRLHPMRRRSYTHCVF